MAYNTLIQQGTFVSTGVPKFVSLPGGADWMEVYNQTFWGAGVAGRGVQFYWQRGFAAGAGFMYQNVAASNVLSSVAIAANGGAFNYLDTSSNPNGTPLAATAITNATPPVVTVGSTASLSAGSVVRVTSVTGATNLAGYDFTIGVNTFTGTTFDLSYMVAPGVVSTAATVTPILFDPIFYPSKRLISRITQAASAVVTMTVAHRFTVGQQVRFIVPSQFGMTQMDGLTGQISAVTTSTITVNIDSSAFTAFAFPLVASYPFSPAMVVPVGEGTDSTIASPNLLDDATVNQAQTGMLLGAGAALPAGVNNDIIYWRAGKSFNV
jgi:hypothetical protein